MSFSKSGKKSKTIKKKRVKIMNPNLVYFIICIAFLTILVFIIPTTYKRLKDIPYLFWGFIMSIITVIIYLFASWSRYISGFPDNFLENVSLIPIDFAFLYFYLYFESLHTTRIPEKKLLLFLFLFLFNLGINFFNSLNLFEYKNFFPLFAAFTYFFGSSMAIFALYVLRKTIKIYNARPVKIEFSAVVLLLIGLILYQISGISEYWYANWAEKLFWIGCIFFVSAFGIITINSIMNGTYIYMIPNSIKLILVYTSGGVLLYNRSFDPINDKDLKTDECMLSGGMSGFSTFFKEILGTETIIKYIDAGSYQFFFEQLPQNSGSFVVFTKSANKMLLRSMKKLVDNLPENYLNRIKNFDGRIMVDEFDGLVKKYFPFLEIPNKH
jgi:hypothetical protein